MGRRIIGWASAVLALVVIWYALPSLEHDLHTRPGDGAVDWLGARAWLAHVNVYSPEGLKAYGLTAYGFAHPPTAPFWLLPYAEWDIDMLGTMMGWTTVVLLVFHLVATARALELPTGLAALAIGAVISTSWFENDMAMAQVSEPIAICYVLAWLALRRGQLVLAGIAVGLACTFKPFAGVLWLMLVSLRHWRAAAAAIIAWLTIAIIMTSRFGLSAWLEWNQFNKATAIVWIGHLRNATLPGLVLRAFHPICRYRGAHPPTIAATLVAAVLGLLILFACHRVSRSWPSEREPHRVDLLFAAWAAASVFVNPVAWEHYAFILITPIAILVATAADATSLRRDRIVALLASAAATALLSIDMHKKGAAMQTRLDGTIAHLRLHALEAANWLPWAVVLFAALYLSRRAVERPA